MYSVCTVQLYNVYKQASAGRRVRPRRAALDRMRQNVKPRFLYFCGYYLTGGVFSFFQVHPEPKYHIVPLSHTQPLPTAPLSHFPQSTTNLIPKPFFAHNSFHIHHRFPPLTPHSHLFPAHSTSFQSHSFYPQNKSS